MAIVKKNINSPDGMGRSKYSRTLFELFSENLLSDGPHSLPLTDVNLVLMGERIPVAAVVVKSEKVLSAPGSSVMSTRVLDADFVAADRRAFPWVFRHEWNGVSGSYGNFSYSPSGEGPAAVIEDVSVLANEVFSGYARLNVLDNLEWFDSLSGTELLQALSFYRKEDLFEGTYMSPPGFIANAADRERLWSVRDVVLKTPGGVPEVDDSVLETGVRNYILNELHEVSVETLYQMRRQLSASGLGTGRSVSLELPRDDGGSLGPTPEIMSFRSSMFSFMYGAYPYAIESREVIGGEFAKDFAGTAHWSRGMDFEAPGVEGFRGLRYINFKDCTNIHALYRDGESKSVESLSTYDLKLIFDGLQDFINKKMGLKHNIVEKQNQGLKNNKSFLKP